MARTVSAAAGPSLPAVVIPWLGFGGATAVLIGGQRSRTALGVGPGGRSRKVPPLGGRAEAGVVLCRLADPGPDRVPPGPIWVLGGPARILGGAAFCMQMRKGGSNGAVAPTARLLQRDGGSFTGLSGPGRACGQ